MAILDEARHLPQYAPYLQSLAVTARVRVIVVDGGSRDASCEIVRRYPELQLIEAPGAGIYAAWNLALRHIASEAYVAFLGVGDRIPVAPLSQLAEQLAARTLDVAYGDRRDATTGRCKHSRVQVRATPAHWGHLPFPHPGAFFSMALFRRFGTFDERYRIAGDLEWLLRIVRRATDAGIRIDFVYQPQLAVELRGGGVSEQMQSLRRLVEETRRAHRLHRIRISPRRYLVLGVRSLRLRWAATR